MPGSTDSAPSVDATSSSANPLEESRSEYNRYTGGHSQREERQAQDIYVDYMLPKGRGFPSRVLLAQPLAWTRGNLNEVCSIILSYTFHLLSIDQIVITGTPIRVAIVSSVLLLEIVIAVLDLTSQPLARAINVLASSCCLCQVLRVVDRGCTSLFDTSRGSSNKHLERPLFLTILPSARCRVG